MWLQQGNGGGGQNEDVEQDVGSDQTTQISISYASILFNRKNSPKSQDIFFKGCQHYQIYIV